jgi:hypothetical protein
MSTRITSVFRKLTLLPFTLALVSCGQPDSSGGAGPDGIKTGVYRAALQLPGGELPFGLDLERESAGWTGYLINAQERLKLNEVRVNGSHLEIKMPGYENRLVADGNGSQLQGEVVISKPHGKDQHLPLRAQYRRTYRFSPNAP